MAEKEATLGDLFLELFPCVNLADAVITELERLCIDVSLDIIKKSGSWFSYNGERLGQGKDTVRKLVESDPAFMAELEEKVRAASAETDLLAAGEFELDEDEDEDDFEIRTLGDLSEDDE